MSNFEGYLAEAFDLFRSGRVGEADEMAQQALSINPESADALHLRGVIAGLQGRHTDAEIFLVAAAGLDGDNHFICFNLAKSLSEQGKDGDSLQWHRQALSIDSRNDKAWLNYGKSLFNVGDVDSAITAFDQALAINPASVEAYTNKANCFRKKKLLEEAVALYNHAIELHPKFAEVFSNRGIVLGDLNRHLDALDSHEKAIQLQPEFAESWLERGNTLRSLMRHEEALESYDKAILLKPNYAEAIWNKALTLLRLGEFDLGWRLFEWRWKLKNFPSPQRSFLGRLWLGEESLRGRAILLHAEQGYGDTIQFCRYVPAVKNLGAKIFLEVPSALKEVLSHLSGVDRVIDRGSALPAFDFHCPLLSLPFAFKTRIETIPNTFPYLSVDAAKRIDWRSRTVFNNKKRSIGIVWAGSSLHENDTRRSIPFHLFTRLISADFNWFSLQKEIVEGDSSLLRGLNVKDYTRELKDFSDTAALILNLDLVISVDTSVAHLSGALNKPAWVLLPYVADFRWMLGREDTPWYASMRLFRQSSEGGWGSVLSLVEKELRDYDF